ncbi:hypothetical protein scyTo_0023471, partial [Scyliorhinus torazame]|nr:hypothetical protein [Scyliorhinus torazame]
FCYKKRVYKQTNVDEKQISKLHTKANLRKFMDYVQHQALEKIVKLLERGLDPNYYDSDSGGYEEVSEWKRDTVYWDGGQILTVLLILHTAQVQHRKERSAFI